MKVDGAKLKKLRNGKPIEDVAKAADLGKRRMQQIEAGDRPNVNLNVAKAIADFYGVPLDKIAAKKVKKAA